MGECHTDITEVVMHGFPSCAPFRRRTSCPTAKVGNDPLVPLIIVSLRCASGIFWRPINLGHHDGFEIHYRHIIMKIGNESLWIAVIIGNVAIPSRIDMNGITKVIITDRILLIAHIVRLITCTRHPDYSGESCLTNNIYYGLEEIVQGIGSEELSFTIVIPILYAISRIYIDGFVGEFNRHFTCQRFNLFMLCKFLPNGLQIILITITHLNILRTNSWRTHNDIKSVGKRFLYKRYIKLIEESLIASEREFRNIRLIGCISAIGPTRIHVQTEHIAIRPLRLVGNSREDFLKEIQTWWNVGCVVTGLPRLPSPSVEIAVGGIHHTVQLNSLTSGINQLFAANLQSRQFGCGLCPCSCNICKKQEYQPQPN